MAIDYTSHPSELLPSGVSDEKFSSVRQSIPIESLSNNDKQKVNANVDIKQLREAIPPHCFERSYRLSLGYLFRDLILATTIMGLAFVYIPKVEPAPLRYVAWAAYGYIEGLVFVGLWVLGHECGHSAFSPSQLLNNTVGFMLHSSLLTPYFSWRSTHRRHHIYANNLTKDHNYVPPQREEYLASISSELSHLEEITEDAPIVTFMRIILQQLVGFPWYLLTNITAAEGSLPKAQSVIPLGNSHFAPTGSLFRPDEAWVILLSDLGLAATALGLWFAGTHVGFPTVFALYGAPYLWLNHWIVAITYLHHTHPSVPKFEDEAWTFIKGATATVDREFGWIGKHMFHGIIEFHVIHHLFSRIPFYHGEEATEAVIPLLGSSYHADKQRPFLPALWESFTKCQWIEPDDATAEPKDRVMFYKGGPSPPPEYSMGAKGWIWAASPKPAKLG